MVLRSNGACEKMQPFETCAFVLVLSSDSDAKSSLAVKIEGLGKGHFKAGSSPAQMAMPWCGLYLQLELTSGNEPKLQG